MESAEVNYKFFIIYSDDVSYVKLSAHQHSFQTIMQAN